MVYDRETIDCPFDKEAIEFYRERFESCGVIMVLTTYNDEWNEEVKEGNVILILATANIYQNPYLVECTFNDLETTLNKIFIGVKTAHNFL